MTTSRRRSQGFTLVELLVVLLIVVLLSVATIAAVLPAFNARRVSEGSRLIQSLLSQARDAAINDNKPHGIRLLPDPLDPGQPNVLTCSRILAIEAAAEYDDGLVTSYFDVALPPAVIVPPQNYPPPPGLPQYIDGSGNVYFTHTTYPYLVLRQERTTTTVIPGAQGTTLYLPNPPTAWFYNLRQGEKIQLNNSGRIYTVAGPIANPTIQVQAGSSIATAGSPAANPERFINFGPPTGYFVSPDPSTTNFEFVFLLNGVDDDQDGFIDEGFDGIDNDGDGIIDPGFNGVDDDQNGYIDDYQELFLHVSGGSFTYPGSPGFLNLNQGTWAGGNISYAYGTSASGGYPNEFEFEEFPPSLAIFNTPYTAIRRPVPSPRATEVPLPTNVVIDLTTVNMAIPERSVLPLDTVTEYTDIMISPNGQVISMDANGNSAPRVNLPYFHFWITERDDVHDLITPPSPFTFKLPMPRDAYADPRGPNGGNGSYSYPATLTTLKGDRRLLSLNTRTGAITSTLIEQFYTDNTDYPYEAAERGVKDVQP